MKLDYETLKTKLMEESSALYSIFISKIVRCKPLGIDFKILIERFNNYFTLVATYIKFIINNEIGKINDTIDFFQNGFDYIEKSLTHIDNDVEDLLSIYLQMLYEAFTEYNFLHTGKAFAFAHLNDINHGGKLHVKFDRTFEEVYNTYRWFDEPKLKDLKNALMSPSIPCTMLSYHSMYIMYHITKTYLKRNNYTGKLNLDYNSIEDMDNKLNEFIQFLKNKVNTNYLYFINNNISVKVKISCGTSSFIDNQCSIEYAESKVI